MKAFSFKSCLHRTGGLKACAHCAFSSNLFHGDFFVHILLDWIIHRFYPQNGICIQKYNFWPKNDGEKWSRKIYFEIPPCGKMVIFVLSSKKNSLPHERISKMFFSRPLFTIICRPKIVFLDTDSILRVKMMYETVR